MAKIVHVGDTVEVNYTGKLKEDDSVFDTTDNRSPFRFEVGGGGIIEGMSDAVEGMKVGEKKSVEIEPERAYGEPTDELVRKVPLKDIPKKAQVGDTLHDSGQKNYPWRLTDFKGELAILDGNHPLAGKTLIFEIELLSISAGMDESAAVAGEEKASAKDPLADDIEVEEEEGGEEKGEEEERDSHIAHDDLMGE